MEPDETRVDRLTALRDRLARLLPDADDRTAPALSREYRAVLAELDSMTIAKVASGLDDLAVARADRLAKASGSDAPAVRL